MGVGMEVTSQLQKSAAGAAAMAPLDYAPAQSRQRRCTRRVVLLALLLAVTIAGVRWGPPLFAKSRTLYWQRRCLTYAPSPDLVVYDQNFDRAIQSPSRGDEYSVVPLRGLSSPGSV